MPTHWPSANLISTVTLAESRACWARTNNSSMNRFALAQKTALLFVKGDEGTGESGVEADGGFGLIGPWILAACCSGVGDTGCFDPIFLFLEFKGSAGFVIERHQQCSGPLGVTGEATDAIRDALQHLPIVVVVLLALAAGVHVRALGWR